jgi:hypothetical protein
MTTSLEERYGEPMRVWTDPDGNGFKVEMFDSPERDRHGKWKVPYRFGHNGEAIFDGTLGASPMHATDGPETLAAILTFCSLQPGDTDPDYFDDYSERQLAWCRQWGETLSLYVEGLERIPDGHLRCHNCLHLFESAAAYLHHADDNVGHDECQDTEGEDWEAEELREFWPST